MSSVNNIVPQNNQNNRRSVRRGRSQQPIPSTSTGSVMMRYAVRNLRRQRSAVAYDRHMTALAEDARRRDALAVAEKNLTEEELKAKAKSTAQPLPPYSRHSREQRAGSDNEQDLTVSSIDDAEGDACGDFEQKEADQTLQEIDDTKEEEKEQQENGPRSIFSSDDYLVIGILFTLMIADIAYYIVVKQLFG